MGNSITASKWIYTSDIENVSFNNSNSGNTYYFSNGAGAWTQLDIKDTTGNGYADSGADRPFSESTLGDDLWEGDGEDWYPGVGEIVTPPRKKTGGRASPAMLAQLGIVLPNQSIESLLAEVTRLQALLAQLQSAQGGTKPTCSPILRQGSRGENVKLLQQRLGVIPQSGFFGPLTLKAVRDFQQSKGIRVDGIAGPQTCSML